MEYVRSKMRECDDLSVLQPFFFADLESGPTRGLGPSERMLT